MLNMKAETRLDIRTKKHLVGEIAVHLFIAIVVIAALYGLTNILVIAGVMLGIL